MQGPLQDPAGFAVIQDDNSFTYNTAKDYCISALAIFIIIHFLDLPCNKGGTASSSPASLIPVSPG